MIKNFGLEQSVDAKQSRNPSTLSESQLKANRENAQKSTGPRTVCGKARSRFNAVKHGLLAKHILPSADGTTICNEGLQLLHESLRDRFGHDDVVAELLFEGLMVDYWRCGKGLEYESRFLKDSGAGVFSNEVPGTLNLARYNAANRKALLKNLTLLLHLRPQPLPSEDAEAPTGSQGKAPCAPPDLAIPQGGVS